jgi:hypothetical protein
MRKIVYAVLFIGVILGVVNLTLTNSLASEGEHLRTVSQAKDKTELEISQHREELMEAQGLGRIERRAFELGLTEQAHQIRLNLHVLANKNSEE